jgi:hypothetical protein
MRRPSRGALTQTETGAGRTVQLRLPLAPPCEWHVQDGPRARNVAPCARDAQVLATDPVRDRAARCCTTHALTFVAIWRQSVPNRRRNAARVTLAWLPYAPRFVALPRVIGARPPRHRRLV